MIYTQNSPTSGRIPISINYRFNSNEVAIKVYKNNRADKRNLRMYIPVISEAGEKCRYAENQIEIIKPESVVYLFSNNEFKHLVVEKNQRSFCPVPGFEFIPLYTESISELEVGIKCAAASHILNRDK